MTTQLRHPNMCQVVETTPDGIRVIRAVRREDRLNEAYLQETATVPGAVAPSDRTPGAPVRPDRPWTRHCSHLAVEGATGAQSGDDPPSPRPRSSSSTERKACCRGPRRWTA